MRRTKPLTTTASSSTSTIRMETPTFTNRVELPTIEKASNSVVTGLSDENYAESFAFYRVWFDVGQAYHNMTSDQIFRDIRDNKGGSSAGDLVSALTQSNVHLFVRYASDVESDPILSPHCSGLQSRLCTESPREFFGDNMVIVFRMDCCRGLDMAGLLHQFYVHTALIA